MPGLAEHQRAMRDLVKGRALRTAGDPYLASLEHSTALVVLREIAVWWLTLEMGQACASTAGLLKRGGTLQTSVARFYREEIVPSYGQDASERFLAWLRREAAEPLLVSLIDFDLALAKLRRGADGPFAVDWDRDPEAVFAALSSDMALPAPGDRHRLHIGREIPGMVRCERIDGV